MARLKAPIPNCMFLVYPGWICPFQCDLMQNHPNTFPDLGPSHHFIPPLIVANLSCFAKDELVLNHHCLIGKLETHGIHMPHGKNMLYYRGWSANRYCAIFTAAKYIVYLFICCSFIHLSIHLSIYLYIYKPVGMTLMTIPELLGNWPMFRPWQKTWFLLATLWWIMGHSWVIPGALLRLPSGPRRSVQTTLHWCCPGAGPTCSEKGTCIQRRHHGKSQIPGKHMQNVDCWYVLHIIWHFLLFEIRRERTSWSLCFTKHSKRFLSV